MTSPSPTLTRPAGRPKRVVYCVAEVARLLELPEAWVRARCRFSFFPGAVELVDGGDWEIPESGVRTALACSMEPLWSIQTWAGLLGVDYHTLYRVTHGVTTLTAPLPAGKRVRALLLPLGKDGGLMMRIPESEIKRLTGGGRR